MRLKKVATSFALGYDAGVAVGSEAVKAGDHVLCCRCVETLGEIARLQAL